MLFPFLTKKKKLKAVYDTDIEKYLKSIGIYDKVVEGKIKCFSCGKKITMEDVEAIVPSPEGIKVLCSNIKCLQKLNV